MRVLALLEASSISGTAKAVLEMAYEANIERGIEIVVGNFVRGDDIPDNALTRALTEANIPFSFIREKGRFDGSVMPQIQHLVKKYAAQVIWSNSVKSHFLVHHSGVQKICKWIAFHHGYTSTDLKMRLYNDLDRVSLRHADRVLTVCRPFADQMRARGVRRARIVVQHVPIRPFDVNHADGLALRSELGLSQNTRIVLSIGRLSHEKGHRDLVAAFAGLQHEDPGLRLVMVGDGPERQKLQKMASGRNVLFVGHRDDARRFYGLAKVFALPSYTEGTPNVLLEAMAAGIPVVATKVGGIPELATDNKDALLVPPAAPSEMANALRKVLQSDVLCTALTLAARQVVSAHAPRLYFERMRGVFHEVVAE